jgi:O-antigen/teichoic acid export membrane protein
LLVAAPEIVEHLLGPAWLGAVPAVRLLAVAGLLRSLAATGAPLFQAIGRPDLEFKQNFPRFVCLVVLLWPAASAFGLAGVCFAVLASLLPAVVVWSWAIHEALDLGPRRQLALVIGPLLAGCLLAPALAGARELMPAGPAGAASALIVGVAAWLAALAVLAPARRRKLLAQLWRTAELLREPR